MANQTRVGAPGATGGIWSAKQGSPLPTNAVGARDAAFVSLGLVGNGGLKDTPSRDSDEVLDWNGDLARRTQTRSGKMINFTLIERRETVLREVFGQSNVTVTAVAATTTDAARTDVAIKYTGDELPIRSYIAEMNDRGIKVRKVIPEGQITDIGEIGYVKGDLIQYDVTMTVYKDSNGVYDYDYEAIPA